MDNKYASYTVLSDGSNWWATSYIAGVPRSDFATGGTITEGGGYRIHTFTSSGTFTVTRGGNVEYLVVGGGGVGSANGGNPGFGGSGGGGAAGAGTGAAGMQGTTNKGSGGGGASSLSPYPSYLGGNGGSGIVIIRYPINQ